MQTQISQELNGAIKLKTNFDGEYPIKDLPPHITRGTLEEKGKIMAIEYLTGDGPLYWYSFETKAKWELRFRDKREELKLLIVTKGKFMLNVKGGTNWSLNPGNICLLNSSDYKIILDPNVKVDYFLFPIKALSQKYRWEILSENRFNTTTRMDEIIRDIIQLYKPEYDAKDKLSCILTQLIIEVKYACEMGQEIGLIDPEDRKKLKEADEYIQKNATSKRILSTKEISMFVTMNECKLKKLYKAYYKRTLGEQQNYYRVLEGKRLLTEENRLVEEAAILSGFNNADTFRDHFVKHFGSKPIVWLKNNI